MARETFVLTQDIADRQLIDTHPMLGTRMQKLVDKTVIDVFSVLNSSVPATTTTKRLDAELNSLLPAVGSGLGVLTTRKHQVFKAGTDHAFVDGATIEINADLAYTAPLTFSINMSFGSTLGTTVGNPGDVQIGDFVSIATPVPYFAQILNKVPNGPNFDLTFSLGFFGGPTGLYSATRIARWLATFKDSTDAPFPMPGAAVDFGILQRVYLSDVDESVIVGPHPEFAPDVAAAGGGGGTITGGGTIGFVPLWTGATSLGDSVIQQNAGNIGIGGVPAAFKLDVFGDVRVQGKLTVLGAIDPTSILLSGGTALYYESNNGATAPLSGIATGRLRYNNGVGKWQVSMQGAAYANLVDETSLTGLAFVQNGNAFGGLASLGTIDANDLRLIRGGSEIARITASALVIGGVAPVGAELLRVVGSARIEGKLTVTGALDPTSVLLSGGTALYFESNDGSTAPVSGATTGRLRYLDSTGRWQQSTHANPYENIQTFSTDIFAATRVVDPAGNGTDLTIATAITNLPAAGGTIFLKQGVYTIAATLVLPGSKNVLIKGAGKGATVLNLTTAAIPLFQIGAAATGKYAVRDLTATGDGATAQTFLDLASAVDVVVENVDANAFHDIVDDSAGAEVVFRNCSFAMPFSGTCSFWRGTGPAGTLVWIYTEATLGTATNSAIVGNPEWEATDSYIGGPGASIYAVGQIIWQTFRLDSAEVTVSVGNSRIDECDFNNAGIIFTGDSNVVGDSVFLGGSPASFLALRFGGVQNVVSGNAFNGGSTTAIDILAAATETVISGNRFFPSYFTCVKNAASSCVVSGNSGIQVIESGAANNNRYTGNTVFSASVIIGADSVVEGVRRKDVVGGTTTDVFVDQFVHANAKGLSGGGSLKNTGGVNSLTVRLTATDVYGTTDTQDTPVPFGGAATWSIANAVGTALPPFVSYKASVKSTTPGSPTTFTLHHATGGAY